MPLLKTYQRALSYLWGEKYAFLSICVANVILAVIAIAEPVLFGQVIGAISENTNIFATLSLWVGFGIFNIIAYVLVARGADRLTHRRRLAIMTHSFEKIIAMPLSWHQQRGTSHVLHTLIRASDTLTTIWLEFMRQHLATFISLIVLIPTALIMDRRLSMVLVLLAVIYIMVARLVMSKTQKGQQAIEQNHHTVFEHISDCISNITVLQSYNRIKEESQMLRRKSRNLLNAQYPVLNWWALASGLNRVASTLSMVIILLLGAFLVTRGQMRIGEVVAFVGFAQLMIGRLDQISAFINLMVSSRAKLDEFFKMEDSAKAQHRSTPMPHLTHVKGLIKFVQVTHQFENSGQGVYDISFEVKPGQTVAIVGPTGAGKTTLINLLQRIYEPSSGYITIDDVDIRSISRESLLKIIAPVFQDTGLFNRSIAANIRIGQSGANLTNIMDSAKIAEAHQFIMNKSNGYDTFVGEHGSLLSGGEKQRIAIARALLKDAPILILDEATSALDVETEARIKKAFEKISHNRTCLIIAHRLSTVQNADLVLFMDHGRLIEKGSFRELAASGGRFAELLRAGGLILDETETQASQKNIDNENRDNIVPFPGRNHNNLSKEQHL